MADVSALAKQLSQLLKAAGWSLSADRFTIRAVEPAFEPISRVWMAGSARSITDEEIAQVRPSRIIVGDFTSVDEVARLQRALADVSEQGTVSRYTHFVDEFWGADAAVDTALADAEASDSDSIFETRAGQADARHVIAHLKLGSFDDIPDYRALDEGMPGSGSSMAILADAGLGKSELLRWHEWRYGSFYRNAKSARTPMDLPPVALRIPLRDFKSLSLDYIAHHLSQPTDAQIRRALPRVSSGNLLRQVVIQGRLILFLDGLDEVAAASSTVDAGISEWRAVARQGGRFVLTSRAGHEASRGSIGRRFERHEIADLKPLGRSQAQELLRKRGTESDSADRIIAALSGPSAGIPLFLLLADHVGLQSLPETATGESRTLVLLRLLELFCERDEARIGVSAAEQIDVLTQIAEWSLVGGNFAQDELLQQLGIGDIDPLARIVKNPHALLTSRDGRIEFKFPEFAALFSARAIAESWTKFGFSSVVGILGSQNLDGLMVESLARLVLPAVITGAWLSTALSAPLILRRNLLGIALARVADIAHSGTNNVRSNELAKVLGERALTNVSLAGLYVDRFDFAGWTIAKIHGHDGIFSYCTNLWQTDHDETVHTATADGCTFESPATKHLDLDEGISRIRKLVKPIKRKNGRGVQALMSRDEAKDVHGWELLVHLGLAVATGKATTARWSLLPDGLRLLSAFHVADSEGADALKDLSSTDQEIRNLVEEFARL